MEQFIRLISKVSILLVFIFTSVIIGESLGVRKREFHSKNRSQRLLKRSLHQMIQGLVFSFLIIIEMLTSFAGPNGIRIDARVVLLNLSATYGPVSGAITTITAIFIRIGSGTNSIIAISSILFVYILELFFIYYERKKGVKNYYKWIYIMSFLTNVINGIYILGVAGEHWKTAVVPAITYIAAFPLFTVVAYSVMNYIKSKDDLLRELSDRDSRLQQKNEELLKMNDSLKENELRLRTMFLNSGEAILLIEGDKITEINRKGMELFGYGDKTFFIGKAISDFILEIKEEGKKEKTRISETCKRVRNGENIKAEVLIRDKSGSDIPLEVFMVDIKVPGVEYIYMSARDIVERKRREGEILYRARHDALTRVANRQYFEEMIASKVADSKQYPLAFMMADVNGLKVVNDVFGHAEGDMLIVKIASVLSRSCRTGDIVARIGGDEFAMLFSGADATVIETVIERVKKSLKQEKIDTLEPSLSLGYAIKYDMEDSLTLEEMAKLADEMMYKNKMEDRKANVRIFLDNMVNRLYEKSPEDREMAFLLTKYLERVRNIDSLGIVTKREVSKLIRYVNIGKLVVAKEGWEISTGNVEEILHPPKLLEAGENILSKIAHAEDNLIKREELLKLNERWDGSGELHLQKDEIPLTIRTFTILFDLYYILEHKKVFGYEGERKVLEVMEAFSGTKYDPVLFEEIRTALLQSE